MGVIRVGMEMKENASLNVSIAAQAVLYAHLCEYLVNMVHRAETLATENDTETIGECHMREAIANFNNPKGTNTPTPKNDKNKSQQD